MREMPGGPLRHLIQQSDSKPLRRAVRCMVHPARFPVALFKISVLMRYERGLQITISQQASEPFVRHRRAMGRYSHRLRPPRTPSQDAYRTPSPNYLRREKGSLIHLLTLYSCSERGRFMSRLLLINFSISQGKHKPSGFSLGVDAILTKSCAHAHRQCMCGNET